MVETVYTSPGGWMSVIKTPKGFFFAQRKGRDSVAVFLIQHTPNGVEVLVRFQPLPIDNNPLGVDENLYPCPITGGIEEGEEALECALREVQEEAGYILPTLSYLGNYYIGTQSNETVHMYMADVTGIPAHTPSNDGTYFESISKNCWMPLDYLLDCNYSACIIGYTWIRELLDRQLLRSKLGHTPYQTGA